VVNFLFREQGRRVLRDYNFPPNESMQRAGHVNYISNSHCTSGWEAPDAARFLSCF